MKYLKYIILMAVIVIIIIIIILLMLLTNNNPIRTDEVEDTYSSVNVIKKISVLNETNNYYVVKNIVQNYYYDLSQFNMTEDDVLVLYVDDNANMSNSGTASQSMKTEIDAYKNKVYNYLNEEYIQKNNITLNNIQEKLGNYNDVITLIDNVYFVDSNEYVRIYFVEGSVIEKNTQAKEKFTMMISVDGQNSAFEITPGKYAYNVELGKELIINKESVENKMYNKYTYKLIDEETYILDMFNDYKNRIMYDLDSAYNNLNEEYRKTKFDSQAEFKKYASNNYYKIVNANISNYQKTKTENYTQYTLLDKNGNYYIFKETAPMQYTLILDTYTIDIPEFTEKYEASTAQEKVILNINKFMQAINDKDYKYAYSILAESFKANNFKTQQEFENYVKTNFFEQNEFDYQKFGDEANTYYTYQVIITDKEGKDNKNITKTFILLLEEGTGFKLSFNV